MAEQASNLNQAAYTVVARRYRPRSFDELIGQEHIAQALRKAIETGRVGHAYLFTGARGVGKTSTARIFAKVLNASDASTTSEDIGAAIDAGEDIDVIEIDGASNRGIEEIRQLRANVNVRPSRARFKIYIIDEVHMLTNQAFNALLKTLEEPPEHVKFIFCTTDPDKIPVTVLSRCQRFDFVPVKFEAIRKRLKEISRAEGYDADDEALAMLARKAAGSMRDSQSLLEQVMSFSSEKITVEQVHALLGTADEGRLLAVTEALRNRDSLAAIRAVDEAIRGGADPGQFAEQLLNYIRDVVAVGIGGGAELLRLANPSGIERLQRLAADWGVATVLSAIQILDEAIVRMRSSVSSITLLEVALVQICQLQDLAAIPTLIEMLQQNPGATTRAVASASAATNTSATAEKKNANEPVTPKGEALDQHRSQAPPLVNEASAGPLHASNAPQLPAVATPSPGPAKATQAPPSPACSAASPGEATTSPPPAGNTHALAVWRTSVASVGGMLADFASLASGVETSGSDAWTIVFPPGSQKIKDYCEVGDRKAILTAAVKQNLGRDVRLTIHVTPGPPPKSTDSAPPLNTRVQRMREVSEHPYIKHFCEALNGEIVRVDAPAATTQTASRPLADRPKEQVTG